MTFDKILDDERLWAVKYDGEKANCFDQVCILSQVAQ